METKYIKKLSEGNILQVIGNCNEENIIQKVDNYILSVLNKGRYVKTEGIEDCIEYYIDHIHKDKSIDFKLWLIASTSSQEINKGIYDAKMNEFIPLIWCWCHDMYESEDDSCECTNFNKMEVPI